MRDQLERARQRAVQRYLDGESASTICASMGYSRRWLYKWLNRWKSGSEDWVRDRSRRPGCSPMRYGPQIEQIVKLVRLTLYDRGLFCGAQAIRWELEDLGTRPLPSVRTIARILARKQLTNRRTSRYEPKRKKYPQLIAHKAGDVHQMDFIGPRFLKGPVRFYCLNSVDLATARCAVEPMLRRGGQATVDAVWASWSRLGLPRHQQVDNELVFYGSPTHPRGMGKLIRLCLLHGVEVWFIPQGEPWRNGVVEKFNDHWNQKLFRRVVMCSLEDLERESLRFEQRHNSRYRYSKLGGKTPMATLRASEVTLRFPPSCQPPRCPLPKPETGRYHLIRFIRSDGILNIFGEKFQAPPETVYEYVRATIDVDQQRLRVYLDHIIVDEHEYRLR